jgi:hypothetical protein
MFEWLKKLFMAPKKEGMDAAAPAAETPAAPTAPAAEDSMTGSEEASDEDMK